MFSNLSCLIECSTGSTPTVETIKNYIKMLSKMGYNALYLGCTDAYKIEGEPYFNYKRGGYTTDEFKEMDAFAKEHGIELIANIQTLGHLDYIGRHASYADLMDNTNIMMVGDERVYALVDKMFDAISKGLTSRKIHIGFDECWGLGQGNYQKKYGPADAKELLLRHLKRVVEIAKKYGYTCEIWHDMLIDKKNTKVTPMEVKAALPDDVIVYYWDYFEKDENELRSKIEKLQQYADRLGYAGTAFKCGSMTSLNHFSIARLIPEMRVAKEKGMDNFMVTLWSDNGAWVNNYTVLPAVFAAAEFNSGDWDGVSEIDKKKFKEITGASYDAMMSLDFLDDPHKGQPVDYHGNRSFWITMTDLCNGGWDLLLRPKTKEAYEDLSKEYKTYVENGEAGPFDYLFETASVFAEFLGKKCMLGRNVRSSYKNKDVGTLKEVILDIDDLKSTLQKYIPIYEDSWLHDNSCYGLEIDQLFLGEQLIRLDYYKRMLLKYLEKGEKIPELENETIVPDVGKGVDDDNFWNSDWKQLVSNVGI